MPSTKSDRKLALVTGGTGGLGTAICEKLHDLGFNVIANFYPADEQSAKTWQSEQLKQNRQFEIIGADVSDNESCVQMAKHVSKQGQLTVLINNAGITRDSTLRNMKPHHWQAVINTNLGSMYNVTSQFVDGMIEAGHGRIVNISSINGQRGQFGQTNYSAAKAGVHGFTMALAQELASKGVTVNTISPGFINTDMVLAIPEAQRNQIINSIPVARVGEPADIAHAVAFLINDQSDYITGNDLCVNGGVFMH